MNTSVQATIVGGRGFIGRHLAHALRVQGWQVDVAKRQDAKLFAQELGHVFYCAGLTADFRQNPYATVDAHVTMLANLLEYSSFTSLSYLSSTRVYAEASSTEESAALRTRPEVPDHLYNLSKLMGESLCLQSGRDVRIVRLSNVYGRGMPQQNFLQAVLSEAYAQKSVRFLSAASSSKDYISIEDVVRAIPHIALNGRKDIYNLAQGTNTSHQEIADWLSAQGIVCSFAQDAPVTCFPVIDMRKTSSLCGAAQSNLLQDLAPLFQAINNLDEAL